MSAAFFSGLVTETSSFSNIPVTLEDWQPGLRRGRACLWDERGDPRPETADFIAFARSLDLDPVGGIVAEAPVGAPTRHADYVALRDELLAALEAAGPVGAVFLALHGAMMSSRCDDCEGDILARVRAVVGAGTPVGAVLDPHAHLTRSMVGNADVLVFMKEYPHTDGAERTREALAILAAMRRSGLRPAPGVFDCRIMGFFPTPDEPMRGFVDLMRAAEREPGVLSVSFVHGFPWGDMPDAGAKLLVYTDGDEARAGRVARSLHDSLWSIRDRTMPAMASVDEAVRRAATWRGRPLVLADVSDNPGGGAPSDGTVLLRALIEAGVTEAAVGLMVDPQAVAACHKAGPGERLQLRLGGKVSRFSGDPLDLDADVVDVVRDAWMDVAEGARFAMGDTAWVRACGVDIALATLRVQMYAPAGFSHLGIDPALRRVLVVKSSTHFRAFFAPIAGETLLVAAPGAIDFDIARLPYRRFLKPCYPRVADPFAVAEDIRSGGSQ